MEHLSDNIIVVASELGILLVAFILLKNILHFVLDRCQRITVLNRFEKQAVGLKRKVTLSLVLMFFVLGLAVIGLNGYYIYRGENLLIQTQVWAAQIPPQFWKNLLISIFKVGGLVILARLATRYIHRILAFVTKKAKAYEGIRANDESIEAAFTTLDNIQKRSIWLLVAIFAAQWLFLPVVFADGLIIALKIYLCIAIGLLIVKSVSAIVDSLDALSKKYKREDNWLRYYDQLRNLIPFFRRSLEYMIYVVVATLVLMQVEFIAKLAEYGPKVIKVIGIIFLSRVFVEICNLIVDKVLLPAGKHEGEELRRRLTLVPIIKSLLRYSIYFVAFVLGLNAIDLNPTPILAGAGLVGIVVGLGAQPLINDLVSGFFILFENLFLVGDYIETGEARGFVEAIDIRTTRLRDPNGQQHILRNGQIAEIVNFSKEYTFSVVRVNVAYESDLNHVYRIIKEVGDQMKKENADVIEATRVSGLQDFGESELVIRTYTKVKPGKHLIVSYDFRKRLKEAFDREGIEIPYARRVVIFKDGQMPDIPG